MRVNACKLVSKHKRKLSAVLLTVMISELLLPLKALALTSGPSQPEFQGFTPLATTSLVDPFSGDFSYNIPLLEIDGYPLNLVYRATSNIEEEGSWVGYGWNVNVGTLNRMVRGLPDDMDGEEIKSYQNIRTRTVNSTSVSVEPHFGVQASLTDGVGVSAGVQASMGFTKDNDNYIGTSVGVSVGAGVYAGVNAGPFSASANAGVTLAANSSTGGTMSTYAGFNAGLAYGEYFSVGMGRSVNRTFNTISGWEKPNVMGSFNISNITREVQRNFINSVSNSIPQVTSPYFYSGNGTAYRLNLGVELGIIEGIGIDLGVGITVANNSASTVYGNPDKMDIHKGYGYMYAEKATPTDLLDFTRDNDGGINKDMPFLPPAMKTFDVFSSTAHNATSTFRADRNDFGVVRDPQIKFDNTNLKNTTHQVTIKVHSSFTCWIGVSVGYDNIKTATEGMVASGGCIDDLTPFRNSNGKDQNLFFKGCGSPSMADDSYINQVNKYGHYGFNGNNKIKGNTDKKRQVTPEPIAVYTNANISEYPQTVIPKVLESYQKDTFPTYKAIKKEISRGASSKIGAILNTNRAGQTYVYATPVNNNIKNEVAFRIDGFNTGDYKQREGLLKFKDNEVDTNYKNNYRDDLYKATVSPGYATSYLLNGVLSPDYVDVTNNGMTDDDLGNFVKFNYTRTDTDYRWRVPYATDSTANIALLNEGVKLTKFDNVASYMAGSKEVWYAHSIESKNYVVEFYISDRKDAMDSKCKIFRNGQPFGNVLYGGDKASNSKMQKLDSIKYFYKHDRYINTASAKAVPLKTIYFDYDYGISSKLPNADTAVDSSGKLRLVKLRVRHGDEPLQFAETYDLGYVNFNPAYNLGDKDGWGNYYPNDRDKRPIPYDPNDRERQIPLCEFPYIDQVHREDKDIIASAFHLNYIGLPSGGKIDIEYEADDYAYVQDRRAMALTDVAGVGASPNLVESDAFGLYDGGLNPYLYVYVKMPASDPSDKGFLLNGANLMYFSFNINIGGNAFSIFDQVKGYAEVEETGRCPNNNGYVYIKVKPVDLTGTNVKPSPMTNTGINMARAFASDQLYFQENEIPPDGHNHNHGARLKKAAIQVADAILGKNSVKELMKDYRAAHKFQREKSYVRLTMAQPKIGGGSRVSKLTFNDDWNTTTGEESSLIGYKYTYKDNNGLSSGVASYEPTLGGEENPMRSGHSYALSSNPSKYPPYDPVELMKEDPPGESFFPAGSVGYGMVTIESIHKQYARSAQSKLVQVFYTAKDFPFFAGFGQKSVNEVKDKDYPNPGIRDILLSFIGVSNTVSSSKNSYDVNQSFVIETNDMHGKPKATYNYRLLQKNNKQELVSSTEYFYHNSGNRLSNEVYVLEHETTDRPPSCISGEFQAPPGIAAYPKENIKAHLKTLGVDIDVCTDSREVVSTETRVRAQRGGSIKICIPPYAIPKFTWAENTHKHVDYFKSTTTTKIINRYGILKSVRNYDEGAETIVENKYYDPVTGSAVVQIVKDKYGDDIYSTNIPAYWTNTALEPSYMDYPYVDTGAARVLSGDLQFTTTAPNEGLLSGKTLLHSTFTTSEDIFHQGDEIFVLAGSTVNATEQWHRLYVADVLVKKDHYLDPDPLSMRYGSGQTTGATYRVYVTPYKVSNFGSGDLANGSKLLGIRSTFRYRSGRKNMLDISAGNYQTLKDPFKVTDSVGAFGGENCKIPSFLRPTINATASRYEGVYSVPGGNLSNLIYNPISTGVVGQPYISATYALYGDRQEPGASKHLQRRNGVLPNWYYWLPNRYDSTTGFFPRKALLTSYDNPGYNQLVKSNYNNAIWFTASNVTTAVPAVGPVGETNPLGIHSSIFVSPTTQKVMHVTANGKFGQTWAETFEDMQQLRMYNNITDFLYSPFHSTMSKSPVATIYEVFKTNQGAFQLNNAVSHSGMYSLQANQTITVAINAVKNSAAPGAYYANLYDFNLDANNNNKYTYEVWVNGSNVPSITTSAGGPAKSLDKVSNTIDGWTLYRKTVDINDNSQVTFTFPSGFYDDLRVYPAAANVKTYVYHPFKTYLMAILDENNYATFYEYNNKNQLVRLKKETEKGIITITENIKNYVVK